MYNNGFNGYGSNNFNTAANNFKTGNVAGINRGPNNIAGIKNNTNNIAGMNKMPMQQDKFATVVKDNSGPAKQVMNSKGQNLIHNEFRGIKN